MKNAGLSGPLTRPGRWAARFMAARRGPDHESTLRRGSTIAVGLCDNGDKRSLPCFVECKQIGFAFVSQREGTATRRRRSDRQLREHGPPMFPEGVFRANR